MLKAVWAFLLLNPGCVAAPLTAEGPPRPPPSATAAATPNPDPLPLHVAYIVEEIEADGLRLVYGGYWHRGGRTPTEVNRPHPHDPGDLNGLDDPKAWQRCHEPPPPFPPAFWVATPTLRITPPTGTTSSVEPYRESAGAPDSPPPLAVHEGMWLALSLDGRLVGDPAAPAGRREGRWPADLLLPAHPLPALEAAALARVRSQLQSLLAPEGASDPRPTRNPVAAPQPPSVHSGGPLSGSPADPAP